MYAKKTISILLALSLVSGSIAGCERPKDPASENVSAAKTRVSFSWWGNDSRHQYTLAGLSLFEEKHPEIEVKHRYGVWNGYEKRQQVMMASHTEADVMQINYAWISKYSPDGEGFYDLNTLTDQLDLSGFTGEDLALGTVNGHLNALPISYNSSTFWYNQTLYNHYNVPVPETWDDLFTAAEAMREDGIYPLCMEKKHLFLMLTAWYEQTSGNPVFGEDGTFLAGEGGIRQMLSFYKKLVDKRAIPPVGEFTSNDFEAGKCAGIACWISDSKRYCEGLRNAGSEIALGQPLQAPDRKRFGYYIKPSTLYAISAVTDHPEEAAALLDYLMNDTDMALLQGTEKGVPASSHAVEALEKAGSYEGFESMATDLMNENRPDYMIMVPGMEDADILSCFKDESDRYIYGQASLEDCAASIAQQIGELSEE